MSVDTLRETFHINRISTSDLQDFLTAQTYRPEITQAKNHILSLKKLLTAGGMHKTNSARKVP